MAELDQATEAETEVEEKSAEVADQFAEADAAADPEPQPQQSVEELASELGWTPKEKFKGDPEKWKPADQFIIDGRKAERNMKRSLEEMRSQMDVIARTNGAIMAEKLQKQQQELAQRYQQAVEAGDPDEAWKAANEIRDLRARAVPQPTAPTGHTVEWAERNPWLKSDPMARARAIEVAEYYARDGQPAEVQTAEAEKVIRREFPHHFSGGEQPASVNGVRSRTVERTPRGTTFKDMPKAAQDIATDLKDRGLIDDVNHYARNYFAQAGKGK